MDNEIVSSKCGLYCRHIYEISKPDTIEDKLFGSLKVEAILKRLKAILLIFINVAALFMSKFNSHFINVPLHVQGNSVKAQRLYQVLTKFA